MQFLEAALQSRRRAGRLRTLRQQTAGIDLTSNDYLGFARSSKLRQRALALYDQLEQNGATGSRLLTGNHPFTEQLEQQIASFHDAEAALLFSTGYAANVGLWSCIARETDTIILDMDVHASTWDGARLSPAKLLPFRHNDLESLRKRLAQATGETFVGVEALYSMSGDIAPMKDVVALCESHGAHVIVDEAHSGGIFGPQGRGLVSALGLEDKIFARVHTFGKAYGATGAVILGSPVLRAYLVNFSRAFIYSTALPLVSQCLLAAAVEQMPQAESERQQLQALIEYYQSELPTSTPAPIQCFPTLEAPALSAQLWELGIDVRPIRPPTVRRGQDCLRICLHAFNTQQQLDTLIAFLSMAEAVV